MPRPTISVDFNERDPEGNVLALIEEAPSDTAVGDQVRLTDAEGNTVQGEVVAIRRGVLAVRALWESWADADVAAGPLDPRQIEPTGAILKLTASNVDYRIVAHGEGYVLIERQDAPVSDLLEVLRERVRSGSASVAAKVE